MSRTVLRRGDRHPLRRLPLSRRRRARRRAEHARRQRPAARRHQARDALPGHVVCLRPGERHRSSSPTTTAAIILRDLMAVDVQYRRRKDAARATRGSARSSFDPVDRSLIGVRHARRPGDAGPHSQPIRPLGRDLHVSLRSRALRPRHFAGRPAALGVDDRSQRRPVPARLGARKAPRREDLKPLSEFRFGQSVPESFVFSPDGRYLYGSSYYTGVSNIFRYEVATGEVEAVSNAETGFFRPVPLADGRLIVLTYTADGLRAGDHRRRVRSRT